MNSAFKVCRLLLEAERFKVASPHSTDGARMIGDTDPLRELRCAQEKEYARDEE